MDVNQETQNQASEDSLEPLDPLVIKEEMMDDYDDIAEPEDEGEMLSPVVEISSDYNKVANEFTNVPVAGLMNTTFNLSQQRERELGNICTLH